MCPTWFPLKPILHRTSLSLRQEDRASFLRRRVSCSKYLAEPSSLTVLSVCGGQDSSCSFRKSSTPTPPLLLGLLSQTFAPRPRGLLSPVLAGESSGRLCTQLTPRSGGGADVRLSPHLLPFPGARDTGHRARPVRLLPRWALPNLWLVPPLRPQLQAPRLTLLFPMSPLVPSNPLWTEDPQAPVLNLRCAHPKMYPRILSLLSRIPRE